MTRMFDATSPSDACPTPTLPRCAGEGAARLLPLARRGGGGPGWGRLELGFARRDGATRARHASTRRRRSAPSSRATSAATSPSPPWPMSAAAWSAATGRESTVADRRGRCGHGDQPGGREGLPLDRRRLPREHPAGGRAAAAGSNGARRRPSCSTAPACGARCASTCAGGARAMLGEMRGARPPGLGRAHEPVACCTTGSTIYRGRRARLDRSPSAGGQLRRACWPRPPGSAAPWRWPPSSMPRPTPRALLDLRPRSRCRPTASARRHRWSTASWSPASWPTDPLALRRAFALFWTRFRAAAAGLPPRPAAALARLRERHAPDPAREGQAPDRHGRPGRPPPAGARREAEPPRGRGADQRLRRRGCPRRPHASPS